MAVGVIVLGVVTGETTMLQRIGGTFGRIAFRSRGALWADVGILSLSY
jgi:hypothetical protein